MSDWSDLFGRFSERSAERDEWERRLERERERLREREEWCATVTERVMGAIATAARRRAEEFRESTGGRVEVRYPADSAVLAETLGHSMVFLALELLGSKVHIYATRAFGTLPHVHLVHTRLEHGSRRTLVSVPGCVVVDQGDGFELRRWDGSSPRSKPVVVDDLVFRAFELLVDAATAPRSTATPRSSGKASER